MAAQAAVGFIKQGCSMLHEGRMELEGAKKTVEGVIGDVKAIKGIFDWFVGLFKQPAAEAKPVAQKKTAKVKQQQSYEDLELKLISEIGANLGVLFDTQQQINNHYLELEETSKTNYDPAQNTSQKAIERALIELQLEKLMEQTREAMVYAPPELKDLYSRFLKMHQKIEREQEWARAETIRRTRLARWKQEQEEIRVIELISGVIAVIFISMIFGWLMWQLRSWSTGY
jgi:F0F1-type ATP synthase assembly protein I